MSFVSGFVSVSLHSASQIQRGLKVSGKLPVDFFFTRNSLRKLGGKVKRWELGNFSRTKFTLIVQSRSVLFTIGISWVVDCRAGTRNSSIAFTGFGFTVTSNLKRRISVFVLLRNVSENLKSFTAFLNTSCIGRRFALSEVLDIIDLSR